MLPVFAVIAALAITVVTSSFRNGHEKPKTEDPLHWYVVDYPTGYPNGVISNGTTSYVGQYTKSTVPNSCSGDDIDCLRGFQTKLPEMEFPTPLEDSGAEQILKENEQ